MPPETLPPRFFRIAAHSRMITRAMAAESACVIGRQFCTYLAFDSADDASKAMRVLKKM